MADGISRFFAGQLWKSIFNGPMNLANIITISRLPCLFIIATLLYFPFHLSRTLAFVLFLLTGFSDWVDGYLARRRQIVSNFGKFMDALSDKILVLGLFIVFLVLDLLTKDAIFFVLIVLAREFFVTGIRLVAVTKDIIISAEKSGKVKTIFQLVSIGAIILEQSLIYDFSFWNFSLLSAWLFHNFGLVLFYVSSLIALVSGIKYTIKYRFVFN